MSDDGSGRESTGNGLSRRGLLGATATGSLATLAGCSGILSGGSGGNGEAPGNSTTVWEDDFESGTLDRYGTVSVPGDDGPADFHVASEPSEDAYALTQRTENQVVVPASDVAVEPPVTATFDVYIDGWAGIDFALPWNRTEDLGYELHVRRNSKGDFLDLQKVSGRGAGETTALKQATLGKSSEAAVFESRSWESVTMRWTESGVEATTATANQVISIEDAASTLPGNPFAIRGYWYNGFAALDNLRIVSPGEPIATESSGSTVEF